MRTANTLHAWALFALAFALICGYCFGQALNDHQAAAALLFFIEWAACLLWLLHIRRGADR